MAEVVKSALQLFLAAQSSREWAPGSVDCCLLLADWAIWLGHVDAASHLRGTYSDEAGFQAIIAASQGVVPLVAGCASRINGRLITSPSIGAIGVIGSPHAIGRQWGAIFDGSRWLVRFRDGVGPISARPLAIWEI